MPTYHIELFLHISVERLFVFFCQQKAEVASVLSGRKPYDVANSLVRHPTEANLRTTTLKGRNCDWSEALGPASSRGGAGDPRRWGWGQASMRVSMALVRGEVTHRASSGIFCSASLLRSLEACRGCRYCARHHVDITVEKILNATQWSCIGVHLSISPA